MDVLIRQVIPDDLDAVARVESVCFPEAEAATRDSFSQRIAAFPESFFVAEKDGAVSYTHLDLNGMSGKSCGIWATEGRRSRTM